MSKRVLFVHDFKFYIDYNDRGYTAVGLPETYFDRFFDAGFTSVDIISRTESVSSDIALERGFKVFMNEKIKVLDVVKKSYLSLFNPLNILRILSMLRKYDLVVLSTPSVNGTVIGLLINLLGVKYSVEVAGESNMFKTKKGGAIFTFFLNLLMPQIVKKADGAAYVSKFLSKQYPNSNFNIIASNVNIKQIYNKKSYLLNSKVIIGFAGGLNHRKGLMTIIEAAKKIPPELDYLFVLCGGHADRDWQKIIDNSNLGAFITLKGMLNEQEMHSFYQKCDLYIQPSYSEGIPRATIEAMSHSLPCIASNIPGFKEILPEEVLFPAGDSTEMTNLILHLCRNEGERVQQGAVNALKAVDFTYDKLHQVRTNYYKMLAEV